MLYGPLEKQLHLETVRSVMVSHPGISLIDLQEKIENAKPWGIKLGIHYLGHLRHEVIRERISRLHRANLGIRVARMQDTIREAQARLMKIVEESGNDMARVIALKEFIAAEKTMLEAEVDAGIYEQKPGTMKKVPQLTFEQKTQVIEVMKKWRIVRSTTEVTSNDQPTSDESLERITAG